MPFLSRRPLRAYATWDGENVAVLSAVAHSSRRWNTSAFPELTRSLSERPSQNASPRAPTRSRRASFRQCVPSCLGG
jgi:hypothetical protein